MMKTHKKCDNVLNVPLSVKLLCRPGLVYYSLQNIPEKCSVILFIFVMPDQLESSFGSMFVCLQHCNTICKHIKCSVIARPAIVLYHLLVCLCQHRSIITFIQGFIIVIWSGHLLGAPTVRSNNRALF